MTDENDPEIIVDNDWKEQVAREKVQAETAAGTDSRLPPMPEASFGLLVTTLTTQTLSALGFIPDPTSGQSDVNRPMAKHFIDTLDVLQEKTKGNLSDDESKLLIESLHQLRMAYVSTGDSGPTEDSPSSDSTGSTIELP